MQPVVWPQVSRAHPSRHSAPGTLSHLPCLCPCWLMALLVTRTGYELWISQISEQWFTGHPQFSMNHEVTDHMYLLLGGNDKSSGCQALDALMLNLEPLHLPGF